MTVSMLDLSNQIFRIKGQLIAQTAIQAAIINSLTPEGRQKVIASLDAVAASVAEQKDSVTKEGFDAAYASIKRSLGDA